MGVYERIKIEEENVHDGHEKNDKEVLLAVEEDGGLRHSRSVSGANADTSDADLEMATSRQIPNSSITVQDCSATSLDGRRREKSHHSQRLVSLDVFRGVSVALMIIVDDAGGVVPAINHSPWNGLTLADFVMPFFLFIVGISLGLAYKKLPSRGVATRKAFLRSLKLFILGLFLQGGYFHSVGNLTFGVDIGQVRVLGILQRIAVVYLITALCEIWLKEEDNYKSGISFLKIYQFQWAMVFVLVVTYMSLFYGLYVPDWEYQIPSGASSSAPVTVFSVKCGVRGDSMPACNPVGMIDRKLLGLQHMYKRPIYARSKDCSINSPDYGPLPPNAPSWCQAPFDPEGLLSSVMAVVTCLIGLHFGHIIVHFKDHSDRLFHWMMLSSCLTTAGFLLNFFGMPVNKALYSCSYTCVTAGAAGFLFITLYLLVDISQYRRATGVFEWMGVHSLAIYTLAASNLLPIILQGFYWRHPQNNIAVGDSIGMMMRKLKQL